jgi:hypothetical protein
VQLPAPINVLLPYMALHTKATTCHSSRHSVFFRIHAPRYKSTLCAAKPKTSPLYSLAYHCRSRLSSSRLDFALLLSSSCPLSYASVHPFAPLSPLISHSTSKPHIHIHAHTHTHTHTHTPEGFFYQRAPGLIS